MHPTEYFKRFIELQSIVTNSYQEACIDTHRRIRSLEFASHAYTKIMHFIWYVSLVSMFIGTVLPLKPDAIKRIFPQSTTSISGLFANIMFIMCYFLIICLLVYLWPEELIAFLERKGVGGSSLRSIRFAHISVIVPFSIFYSATLLQWLATGTYKGDDLWNYLLGIAIIDILVYAVGFNFGMFFPLIPDFILVLISRLFEVVPSEFAPSYDRIMEDAVGKSCDHIKCWNKDLVVQIRNISETKSTSLVSQSQVVAPIFGSVSLFGLLALIFSQDQVSSFLRNLESWLAQIANFPSSGIIIGLAITILLILVYTGCYYFIRVYQALWLLQILRAACDIRIAEAQQEESKFERDSLLSQLMGIR